MRTKVNNIRSWMRGVPLAATAGRVFALDPGTGAIQWSNGLPGLGHGLLSMCTTKGMATHVAAIAAQVAENREDDAGPESELCSSGTTCGRLGHDEFSPASSADRRRSSPSNAHPLPSTTLPATAPHTPPSSGSNAAPPIRSP